VKARADAGRERKVSIFQFVLYIFLRCVNTMIVRFCSVVRPHYIVRLTSMAAIFAFCLALIAGCTSSDSVFDLVQQSLQNVDRNPTATFEILEKNLSQVKNKAVIPLLLDYFREAKQRGEYYPSILAVIALYFEKISGIESHVIVNITGPYYTRDKEWRSDMAQWQDWWDKNGDYIYWDEQAQSLKVKSH